MCETFIKAYRYLVAVLFSRLALVVLPIFLICVSGVILLLATQPLSLQAPKHNLPPQPDCVMDVLDPSLEDFAQPWQVEISRRFHNSVGVLCHGGSIIKGQWIVLEHPDSAHSISLVTDLIAEEQKRYPGRTIVLLCCNVEHETLHGYPGVYYAASSVWCVPDRDTPPFATNADMTIDDLSPANPNTVQNRSVTNPDPVGNIFEFQSAE